MEPALVAKTLAKIGYVLLNVQSTERIVKRVMQIAMPREEDLFVSLSERVTSKDMDRPLGPFLAELRKRAQLHVEVEALLKRFLARRNTFIHDISDVAGWTLTTKEGIQTVDDELRLLVEDSKEVRTLFTGLLYAWKVQGELEPTREEEEAFRAISGKYEGGVMSRRWGRDS